MNSNTLGVVVQNQIPKTFTRGQLLEFVMELPPEIPADFFGGASTTTELTSELRQVENAGKDGLIAPLEVSWEPGTFTKIRFHCSDTNDWPLGPAEFDVKFTRTVTQGTGTPTVQVFRSQPVQFIIKDGVTA